MRIIKGQLPPSVFCPPSKTEDDVTGQVKVKRKCGRPRNPIPRHKRESHINAEHRRRGKIQNGFRTLKVMIPKYEQTSGRDSKADILFKAVDNCKLLQQDIKDINSSIEALKLEKDSLNADIKDYKELVPDLSVYEGLTTTMDDRYNDYVGQKSKEHWTFGTFKVIMRPLFESYKVSVRGESMGDFLHSVSDWASNVLSLSNLRAVCMTALKEVKPDGDGSVCSPKDTLSPKGCRPTSSSVQTLQNDTNSNPIIAQDHSNKNHHLQQQRYACHNSAVNGYHGNQPNGESSSATGDGSILAKANPSLGVQHYNHHLPYSGNTGNLDSGHGPNGSIFSDLYYSLEQDLHHHLNYPRSAISACDNWQHHIVQHHHLPQYHYPEDHVVPPSSHFHDLGKPHPFWSNTHHTSGELAPLYYSTMNSITDRDVKYDLASPEEAPGFPMHQEQLKTFHHRQQLQHRRKSLSQSSSESETSMLNMGTFSRQATDAFRDSEKYSQLSPSTDGCLSPNSGYSVHVGSPTAVVGRAVGDSVQSYRSPHLDHYHRSSFHDRRDINVSSHSAIGNRLSMSLPSYRDAFGTGARLGSFGRTKRSASSFDNDEHLSMERGHIEHGDRYESPSLLAELLSPQHAINLSKPASSSDSCLDTSAQPVDDNRLLPQNSPLPMSKAKFSKDGVVHSPDSTGQFVHHSIDSSKVGSHLDSPYWYSPCPKPSEASPQDSLNGTSTKHERDTGLLASNESHLCYFELAHQQLLESQNCQQTTCSDKSLSSVQITPAKRTVTFSPDVVRSTPESAYTRMPFVAESKNFFSPVQIGELSCGQQLCKKRSFDETLQGTYPRHIEADTCKRLASRHSCDSSRFHSPTVNKC